MTIRFVNPGARAAVFVLASCGLVPCTVAEADCTLKNKRMKQEVLDSYEKNPKWLLTSAPYGGWGLEDATGQLAARGAQNVALIFSVVGDAKPEQQVSVGRGLRTAADTCQSQDAKVSAAINSAVAANGQRVLKHAFTLSAADAGGASALRAGPVGRSSGSEPLPAKLKMVPGLTDPFSPLPDPFGSPDQWR